MSAILRQSHQSECATEFELSYICAVNAASATFLMHP
jgi:hypothetical protein